MRSTRSCGGAGTTAPGVPSSWLSEADQPRSPSNRFLPARAAGESKCRRCCRLEDEENDVVVTMVKQLDQNEDLLTASRLGQE